MNTFFGYLKQRRNLIVIWSLVNLFALFVNKFNIDVCIYPNNDTVYLFTNEPKSYENSFWPFVHYVEKSGFTGTFDFIVISRTFNGIFFNYDISEFIFYISLIFVILYFVWNSKQKRKSR